MRRVTLLALVLVGGGCFGGDMLTVPSHRPDLRLSAWIYRPPGPQPVPAVIVLHGCGGVGSHVFEWGTRLASWGYAALVLDSFGPRGYSNLCLNNSLVGPGERVADVDAAARYLGGRSDVRGDRIGLVGFSHGGWTVQRLAALPLAKRFAAAVAYYPWCEPTGELHLPLLILIGDRDDWTPPERCRLLEQSNARKDLLTAVYYRGATHSFDLFRTQDVYVSGEAMGRATPRLLRYDVSATRDARQRTREWLERFLK
jgi:dienelactone hydrolase